MSGGRFAGPLRSIGAMELLAAPPLPVFRIFPPVPRLSMR